MLKSYEIVRAISFITAISKLSKLFSKLFGKLFSKISNHHEGTMTTTYTLSSRDNSLLSEVIFTNDEAFAEIDAEKAKMILCVCKNAKNNKNIKKSIDNAKARNYHTQIKNLSSRKTSNEFYNRSIQEFDGVSDLNIERIHRERIRRIITSLLKENRSVIERVKERMSVEQIRNIDKYCNELQKAVAVIDRLGIDMNNITEEDRELCEEDEEYYSIKYNRIEIATIYKYNSYLLNMLEHNLEKEDEIIEYISTKEYDDTWWCANTPTIHPIE
jgi:hypothetical protein